MGLDVERLKIERRDIHEQINALDKRSQNRYRNSAYAVLSEVKALKDFVKASDWPSHLKTVFLIDLSTIANRFDR